MSIVEFLSFDTFFFETGISILFFNIIVYIVSVVTIFNIFFILNIYNLKSLTDFKSVGTLYYFTISIVAILLSMAGMPPLMGFVSKFLIFIFLLIKQQFLVFIFFSILSIFSIYFYIQNIKFIVTKSTATLFFIKNNYSFLNLKATFFSIIFNSFNIFGLFIFNDILIYINYIFSFISIS